MIIVVIIKADNKVDTGEYEEYDIIVIIYQK